MRIFPPLLLVLAAFFLVTACGQVASTKLSSPAGTSGTSANPSAGTGSSDGTVVNSSGFFAQVANSSSDILTSLHIADASYGSDVGTGNFTTECKVAYGTTGAAADIFCILEIEELDLRFTDLKIQVHVPTDMCSYLRVKPYNFYRFQPHDGPSTADYTVNADGSITDGANTVNGTPTCQYDHTADGFGNCCTGSYTSTVTTMDSSGGSTTNTTAGEWGGHSAKCLAGAGIASQTLNSTTGEPYDTLVYVEGSGFNRTYQIDSFEDTYYTSVHAANFYNPSDHTSGKPAALIAPTSAEVADVSERYEPNDTYAWECLNRAEDLNARIRIMIREWNTHALASGGNPDVTGTDPIDSTQPLNDREDWLDFGDIYPGATM